MKLSGKYTFNSSLKDTSALSLLLGHPVAAFNSSLKDTKLIPREGKLVFLGFQFLIKGYWNAKLSGDYLGSGFSVSWLSIPH